MPDAARRVVFLNSGILGHRTVGGLVRDVGALLPVADRLIAMALDTHHADAA